MKAKLILVIVLAAGVIAALGEAGQPEEPTYSPLDSLPEMVGVADENGRPVMCGGKELKVPREELIGPPPPRPFVPVGPPGAGAIAAERGADRGAEPRGMVYRCGPNGEPVQVPAKK
jgi:hypothetical protein